MRGYMLLSFIFVLMTLLGQLSSVSASSDSGSQDTDEDDEKESTSKWVDAAAVGAIGSFIVAKAGTAAGFTTAGIAKASLAATFQSVCGTPVIFSALQSIGATGGMAVLGPVGVAGAAVAGIGYYIFG